MKSLLIFPGSLLYTLLFFLSVLVIGSFVLLPDPLINEKKMANFKFFHESIFICVGSCVGLVMKPLA